MVNYCRMIGVRWRRPHGKPWEIPGTTQVVGFDLFRIYGIAMPGADDETYQEMMDAAVLGPRAKPEPAA